VNEIGKVLVVAGVVLAIVGGLLWSGFGRGWLGRLPGDIHYTRGNVSFYFPLVTSILLSVVLSAVVWLLRKF
jgi:hypothetical protein